MSGALLPNITRNSAVQPLYDPYGSDPADVNVVASTITVSGGAGGLGITMLNDAGIVFASGAAPGADSYGMNLNANISTSSGVVNAASIYNYGTGTMGTLQVGNIAVSGAGTAAPASGTFAVIGGDSSQNMSMRGNTLDLQFSTITNSLAGNGIITFADSVFVKPSGSTGAGSVSILNGSASSNFNQYTLAVNGDGAGGGELALTRFQGASSYPVYNIDNDGNMLFKDPGAIVYADNLSTIALQAGSIVVPNQGRTLVSSGSPIPSAALNSGATIANIDFAGSVGQFIAVTTGGIYSLQGTLSVTGSAGLNRAFTVNVVSTDGVTAGLSYPIYNATNTTVYSGTGALTGVQIPICAVFKATDNKVSVSCSCPTITGAETLDFAMSVTTISRLL